MFITEPLLITAPLLLKRQPCINNHIIIIIIIILIILPCYALMSSMSICVVTAVPLITVKHLKILRIVAMNTRVLVRVLLDSLPLIH